MRRTILSALTKPGTDQLAGLDLHQLLRDHSDRPAAQVCMLITQRLPDDVLDLS